MTACEGSGSVRPVTFLTAMSAGVADMKTKTELILCGVLVAGAGAFLIYLLADGCYHRLKWKRIRRKFRESADRSEGPEGGR